MNKARRLLFKVAAGFAVAAPRGLAAQNLTFSPAQEIETAVRALVRVEIGRAGVVQGTESAGITDAFLRDGVAKFVAGGGLKDDLAISRLIDSARVLGRELARGATNNRIGETTLASIRSRICPLFPFC